MNRHEFIDWHEDVRVGTRRLIAMVPEEAFEYRASDEAPTVEQLMRVFASLEDQFTRGVCAGDWSDPANPSDARRQIRRAYAEDTDDEEIDDSLSEPLDNADAVLEHLDRIHQESLDIIAQLSDEEFQARKVQVPWGEEATMQRLMIGMVEREIHHRTELYLALKQYGIPMSRMIIWGP